MTVSEADEFVSVIRSEDPIGAVLRAHLLVEQALNELLNYKTQHNWSKKVYGRRFEYLDKVRIAAAFGLIGTELFAPLQKLGELRNDLAHKLDYVLSDKEQKKFLRSIPEAYRDNAARVFALANEILADQETDASAENIHYLPGLAGRRAVSFEFAAGLFALLFKLWSLRDDLEKADEEKVLEQLDEQESDT